MRIVGGSAGGRSIRAPRGRDTRPTSDKVRQAVFNILGPPAEGARVLDLYAGSGALGLEALSRGAAACVLVDRAAPAIRMAGENARALGFADRVRLVTADAVAALPRLEGPFLWIFVDPPYASDQADRCLASLGGAQVGLLAGDSVVIVEHDHRRPPAERQGALARRDLRRWGDTAVSFYQRTDERP
jgi:16S rRNA (guanine966-N2)-methyltransferase